MPNVFFMLNAPHCIRIDKADWKAISVFRTKWISKATGNFNTGRPGKKFEIPFLSKTADAKQISPTRFFFVRNDWGARAGTC